MELQAEGLPAVAERLILIEFARRQTLSTPGQRELMIVRLQRHQTFRDEGPALTCWDQRVIAIFMKRIGVRPHIGAKLVGKTVTEELAFSVIGTNPYYGTPKNVAAPGRVPGGSSSVSQRTIPESRTT